MDDQDQNIDKTMLNVSALKMNIWSLGLILEISGS